MDVSQVLHLDAARALATLAAKKERFGLIFLDPPYDRGLPGEILPLVARKDLLAPGGLMVVEHSRGEELAAVYQHLACRDERCYGDTVISFYEHRPETSG
jgi:16S rRNA (guanine966-N2)-methyltransferase